MASLNRYPNPYEELDVLSESAEMFGMEIVNWFYHVCKEDIFNFIRSEGTLCPHKALEIYPGHNTYGVWFCASLFKGDLPDRSPYGTYRLKFSTEEIIALYSSLNLYFMDSYTFATSKVQYVRLLLSNEDANPQFLSLDIGNNPFLQIRKIETTGKWQVEVCKTYSRDCENKIYVEILVDKHVILRPEHKENQPNQLWDRVQQSQKNKATCTFIPGIHESIRQAALRSKLQKWQLLAAKEWLQTL